MKLNTKRLLAYKNSLYKYPETRQLEVDLPTTYLPRWAVSKELKEWKDAVAVAKEILATREHIKKKPSR